jgi:hypothetical protein
VDPREVESREMREQGMFSLPRGHLPRVLETTGGKPEDTDKKKIQWGSEWYKKKQVLSGSYYTKM